MAPVQGYAAQLGIDTSDPVAKRFDFFSEGLVVDEEMPDLNGLRGTRARSAERVRQGIRHIHGPLSFEPTAAELANLLTWIFGGASSGSGTVTYPLADALSSRYVTIDRVQKVFKYTTVYVNRCTFRGSYGQPIRVELDVVGADESIANAGTFPSINLDVANSPFMFFDLVLTIGGSAYQPKEWELSIDNALDTSRFFNSQTLTAIAPQDRHITTSFALPYGDASAIYNTGAPNGVSYTAVFTNGGAVLSFTGGKFIFPRRSPSVPGRTEIMVPISGTLYKTGAGAGTLELVTTLNVGP